MSIKIISLVPSLGFYNSPVGTILEVNQETADRCIANGTAKLFQAKETPKQAESVNLDEIDFDKISMGDLRELAKRIGIKGTSRKYRKELTALVKKAGGEE